MWKYLFKKNKKIKKNFETKKTAFLREVQILCAKVTSELANVVDLVIW